MQEIERRARKVAKRLGSRDVTGDVYDERGWACNLTQTGKKSPLLLASSAEDTMRPAASMKSSEKSAALSGVGHAAGKMEGC